MASVSTYLNFAGTSEEAFNFYASVFGTEIMGIYRFGDNPPVEGQPELSDEAKQKVMNIALPITGGHVIMATDALPEMGFDLVQGNNAYICLDPDTRAEADRLFAALGEGGTVEMDLADQSWGDYFGSLKDKFGTLWMINCTSKE